MSTTCRARYYDPATAQFLALDPMVAQTWSPYGYVSGNPLNLSDPSGAWGLPDWATSAWNATGGQVVHAVQEGANAFDNSAVGRVANGWANGVSFGLSSDAEGAAGAAPTQSDPLFQDGNLAGIVTGVAVGGAALRAGALATGFVARCLGDLPGIGRASALFGRAGGLLNSNNIARLGWGWNANRGREVFRLAVGSRNAAFHGHFDVF